MSGFLRRLRRPKEEEAPPEEGPPEAPQDEGEAPSPEDGGTEEVPAAPEPEEEVAPPPRRAPLRRLRPPARAHSSRPTSAPTEAEVPAPEPREPEPSPEAGPEAPPGPAPASPTPTPETDSLVEVPRIAPMLETALPGAEAVASPILPASSSPPLPEADREAAMSSLSRHRTGSNCFLCATPMQGSFCPTCRMDWNE